MWMTKYISACIIFILYQALLTQSQCTEKYETVGSISHTGYVTYRNTYQKCWIIVVPESKFLRIKNLSQNLFSQSCSYAYLRLRINETNENYTFCSSDTYKNPITALTNVRIELYYQEVQGYTRSPSFSLYYEMQDVECVRKDSFHCTNISCIPKSKVCDGIRDCVNGSDEVGCETGILAIEGIAEARARTISWLKSKRNSLWGWHENTPRAITALFLANGANYSGTSLEEELMAKQTELKTAIALLKNPISNELLSMFINSLLVTCHSPYHFYGQNLVKRLKDQVEMSSNFTHPIAYLTLCNANETWPHRAASDLNNIFNSNADYHFVKDIQAFAVMAISCYKNNSHFSDKGKVLNLLPQVKRIVKKFKEHQLADGSFGNVETTSLLTQALISNGQEHAKDWKMNATVKFLIKELNSTEVDFSAVYLTLPLFNGKSMADIFKVNCTGNPRKRVEGNLISEINDYVGPKMRIQYTLVVGEDKDVIHTLSVKVPENYTAYEVMKYAEEEDYKYKFEWKKISGKMYVYKIGKVTNDPEAGKFWLLYLGSINSTDVYNHTTSSPDQITLSDEDHLVMWFKTATI